MISIVDSKKVNGKKSATRPKLKTASQEWRPLKGKEHYKNCLRNLPEITDQPIQKIINGQLDIKQEQFKKEEL